MTAAAQIKAHKTPTTILEEQSGEEHDAKSTAPCATTYRSGRWGPGQLAICSIGYSRLLWVFEKMFERMFLGVPPGMHDLTLDYLTAFTGMAFFAPSASCLMSLDSDN